MSGVIATRRAAGSDAARTLRTARTAVTLSVLSMFGTTLVAELAPVFSRVPGSARKDLCLSSMRSIVAAFAMYRDEWGRQPPAGTWSDATRRYTSETYRCPEGEAACGYAQNKVLIGLPASSLAAPERTVALFESDRGWNAEGGPELLPSFPRHYRGDNIGFADGHVLWYERKAPRGRIRWDTEWPRRYQRGEKLQWELAVKEGVR